MPAEVAIATPFEASEIKQIAVEEFKKRLDGLSPLFGSKEYAGFELTFQVAIKLKRAGDAIPRETLAWGGAKNNPPSGEDLDAICVEIDAKEATFVSKEPNVERVERGMPVTVEVNDGKGGKARKKVHLGNQAPAKSKTQAA